MRNLMKIFSVLIFALALFSCVPNVAPSPAYAGSHVSQDEQLLFIESKHVAVRDTEKEHLEIGVREDMSVDFCVKTKDAEMTCTNTPKGEDIYVGSSYGFPVFALNRSQYIDGELRPGYYFYLYLGGNKIMYLTTY